MTSWFGEPQTRFLGAAVFMLGAAYAIIKWVGRTLRDQLGAGDGPRAEPFVPVNFDNVPPELVKEAMVRGLITPAQLAGMAPAERQFVFASMREKLLAPAAATAAAAQGTATPSTTPAGGPAVPGSAAAARPHVLDGAEFGLAAMPSNDSLRVFCPLCGAPLELPAFPPLVAHCRRCAAKTAVREDEGGRYVLHVSPPPPPEVPGASPAT